MARDIFGNRRVTKQDLYTKKRVSHSDVRSEYWKMVIWVLAGYLFFHFVIMGWGI